MRCRRSDKGGRPATGFHNSESTGVLHSASWPARALEARVMRRADKQVGWGPDGWKAAALAAFIVLGASAAWSWAAPIGLELSRRSAFQALTFLCKEQVGPGCSPPRRTSQVFGFKVTNGRQAADTVGSGASSSKHRSLPMSWSGHRPFTFGPKCPGT